jgi:SAM-dependent methyltransferase
MKERIQDALRKAPWLYRLARRTHKGLCYPHRIVQLSAKRLPRRILDELQSDPRYAGVLEDLVAYTGFSAAELEPYLLRFPEKHQESEFAWFAPGTDREVDWFYRCSSAYLFGNATHPYQSVLDALKGGRALDFGAGAGCNTIPLAVRGVEVDFIEISRVQADFIRFRAARRGLGSVRELPTWDRDGFDPLAGVAGPYDGIVAMDVLEHIPNYPAVARRLAAALKPGGLLFENCPFDPCAERISIHVRPVTPLEQAFGGLERVAPGVWRKSRGGPEALASGNPPAVS